MMARRSTLHFQCPWIFCLGRSVVLGGNGSVNAYHQCRVQRSTGGAGTVPGIYGLAIRLAVVVNAGNTRPCCISLGGTAAAWTSPFWALWTPGCSDSTRFTIHSMKRRFPFRRSALQIATR